MSSIRLSARFARVNSSACFRLAFITCVRVYLVLGCLVVRVLRPRASYRIILFMSSNASYFYCLFSYPCMVCKN